jgi:hypothetical protein
MANNHSAEWLRGAIEALDRARRDFTVTVPELQAEYVALLAAAEAREAKERGAWILSQNTEPKPHDWFHSGLSAHPSCRVCGIIQRRDGKNSPCKGPVSIGLREASVPTAAEVIAECKRLLIDARAAFGPCDHSVGICDCDMDTAIEKAAAWEAAQRG